MGCSGGITNLEDDDDDDDESQGKLMIRRYTGILFPNSNFVDTLIKSDDELNLKLRKYIPSRIKEENSDELIYNIKDDILTQSVEVDFGNQYIIAINGINYVFRVEEEKNNYVVYHDNKKREKEFYIAIVVKKIEGEPRIILSPPKMPI